MHSGLWHIGMGTEVPIGIVIWRSTSLLPWLMVLKAPHVEEFVQEVLPQEGCSEEDARPAFLLPQAAALLPWLVGVLDLLGRRASQIPRPLLSKKPGIRGRQPASS